jgi:hypothetical protein
LRGVGGEVGVTESTFERDGFDGFAADRAWFCIFVHDALLFASQ